MTDLVTYVKQQEQFFTPVIADEKITFAKESQFAIQSLQKNDYLAKLASSNLTSLQNAIINVAAIGITLNPASKLAYLVPRQGGVCLDISYMGLMHLAQSTGSILWGQCEIIYKNDTFRRVGFGKAPIFEADEFGDRGEPVGAACVVKTRDGDFLVETMSKEEIYKIRGRSESYKRNSGPWVTDEMEMWRKTVVKRGAKYWPKVERLDTAIEYLNSNGEGIEKAPVMEYYSPEIKQQEQEDIEASLKQQLDDLAFQMDSSENEEQLKAAFRKAFNLTRNNQALNQQAQKIYSDNKNRLGIK